MKRLALLAAALVLPATSLNAETLANPSADLAAGMRVCAASLSSRENPPLADGWKAATHMSGSPLAALALKNREDIQAMLAGMRHSRETFVLAGRHLTLTQYYISGEYLACGLSGEVPATDQPALAQTLTGALPPVDRVRKQVSDLRRHYLFVGPANPVQYEGYTAVAERGAEPAPNLFSILIIKD